MAKQPSKHFTVTLYYPDSTTVLELDLLLLRGLRDSKGNRPDYIDVRCNRFSEYYTTTEQTKQTIELLKNTLSGGMSSRGGVRLLPAGFHKQIYKL